MEFPARTDATAVVPVMPAEAANLRELANRADNRFLRVLLRAQAVYEDAFADTLPTYQPPRDARLWQAALTFRAAADAVCTAITPGDNTIPIAPGRDLIASGDHTRCAPRPFAPRSLSSLSMRRVVRRIPASHSRVKRHASSLMCSSRLAARPMGGRHDDNHPYSSRTVSA